MEVCANVGEACRLCLHGKGKISVFEDGNTNLSITPENIFNCVSVKITKDDRLPTGICEDCILNVENWCSFKITCDKTQETLNDWLKCNRLNADFEKEFKGKPESMSICCDLFNAESYKWFDYGYAPTSGGDMR